MVYCMVLVQINSHDYELFKIGTYREVFFFFYSHYTVIWNSTYNSISKSQSNLVVLA